MFWPNQRFIQVISYIVIKFSALFDVILDVDVINREYAPSPLEPSYYVTAILCGCTSQQFSRSSRTLSCLYLRHFNKIPDVLCYIRTFWVFWGIVVPIFESSVIR